MGAYLTLERCAFTLNSQGRRRPRETFSEHGKSPQLIAQKTPCCGLDFRKSESMEQRGLVNARWPSGRAVVRGRARWHRIPAFSHSCQTCQCGLVRLKPWHRSCLDPCRTSPSGTEERCRLQHPFTRQLCCGVDVACSSPVSHHVPSPCSKAGLGWACCERGVL